VTVWNFFADRRLVMEKSGVGAAGRRFVEKASRSDRLASFVSHARTLIRLARPVNTCLLRVLDALTPDDVEEMGKWEIDKQKSESIVDRLTAQLGLHRQGFTEH
jgi:hypothetical protein